MELKVLPEVDRHTGELPGQLMLGFQVETVAVQRRADTEMTPALFNRAQWDFEEGDRLTATMKDGKLRVKLTTGWGRE